jgi:hypothetical protein
MSIIFVLLVFNISCACPPKDFETMTADCENGTVNH